jgi:predicted metal-dependent HD superfamily phosphohydrolase
MEMDRAIVTSVKAGSLAPARWICRSRKSNLAAAILQGDTPMTPLVNFERWSNLCVAVGVAPDEGDYRRVRRAWRSLGRHYHTLSHLDSCLREFDTVRTLAMRPEEAELALWFHDAVYRSWRRDNEAQSAALAARVLRAAPADVVERIRQMILATTHRDGEFSGDTALVLDVDLSILAAPPEVYAQFERAIRREYWWVARARYVAGRGKLLNSLLARPAIYQQDLFYEKYEQAARANIAGALRQLEWK